MGYLLGLDIGSSSIKAALLDSATNTCVASASSPKTELEIISKRQGWAEQHPETWWQHIVNAISEIKSIANINLHDVEAIGISYQMHGLVTIDSNNKPVRPAIIWCDSRAVKIGEKALAEIGKAKCQKRLLNSPGNFTASKLKWVRDNEASLYKKVRTFMLPGDYIAMKLTGVATTTESGLSEGILWDFAKNAMADFVLEHFGIAPQMVPGIVPTFGIQGTLTAAAANIIGLKTGTPVSYRAGDQPNNALSLNVLNPGEIAATAGTSGVVYGVGNKPAFDSQSRVNTFVHVNHSAGKPRYGTLLCCSGTGILNSWLKHNTAEVGNEKISYDEINDLAMRIPAGSQGLTVLPFGNGAERTLCNRSIGASIHGLEFNTHSRAHLLRAAQEGIVFALNYGLEIMKEMEIKISTVRAGYANMFLSPVFAQTFATISGATVELYNTDGAQGAARGAGIGAGVYSTPAEAFAGLTTLKTVEPDKKNRNAIKDAYSRWKKVLSNTLEQF